MRPSPHLPKSSPIYKLVKKFEQYELYTSAAFVLIVLVHSYGLPGVGSIFVMIASVFSVCYFFSAFLELESEEEKKEKAVFLRKLNGMGAAIGIVGILYKAMHWPGANSMTTVGMLTCLVWIGLRFFYRNPTEAFKAELQRKTWRAVFIILLAAMFLLVPATPSASSAMGSVDSTNIDLQRQ